MGALRNNMIMTMRNRGYSEKTIKLYTSSIRSLATYFNKTPLDITKQQIEDFIYHLRMRQICDITIHVYFEAIKFFFRLHGIADRLPKISFKRTRNKLPAILSQSQTFELLNSCTSLKYKTIFSLIYSAGLRVSEAANLKLSDIDFSRKTVFIRNGKNKKDRYTILANETIDLLKKYYTVYHPQKHVFYSRDVLGKISIDCIQRNFRNLIRENNLDPSIHVHTLRHCFATHLLENGTSIFYIMNLLGHSNIQTTMVYLHMRSLDELNIQSPIDSWQFERRPHALKAQQCLFQESA